MKVSLRNLSITYKNKKEIVNVFNNLNYSFESNKFHVILGKSGCGKTSLLKAILGILDYSGDILLDEQNGKELTFSERNMSFVSQSFVLYPHMTIFENLAFPLKSMKVPREEILERVYEIAKNLDLMDFLSRKPKHLSGGQQQRVAIARALIKKPSLILFDEPLSNLDEEHRKEIRHFIKITTKKYGVTAIYVTHDIKEAVSLADNLIYFKDAKIAFSGTSSEFLKSEFDILETIKNDYRND